MASDGIIQLKIALNHSLGLVDDDKISLALADVATKIKFAHKAPL